MLRMYLTRLVLPVLLVAATLAVPFVWLPEVAPPAGESPPSSVARTASRPDAPLSPARATPFQRAMTVGFALILASVTAGGWMLYRITRAQTAGWRRRFAPPGRRRGRALIRGRGRAAGRR